MPCPQVSVVIPAYNRRDGLLRTLHALNVQEGYGGLFEVVVADDGSTDGTDAALRGATDALCYPLVVVRLGGCGPAVARNCGLAVARGGIVLFTDSDCEPTPGWLQAMAGAIVSGAQAAGGRVEVPVEAGWFAWCVNYTMQCWLGGMGRRWALGGLVPGYRLRTGCMAASMGLLREVGGFREDLGCYGEDAVLSEMIVRSGARVEHRASATVVHREERSWTDYCLESAAKGAATARLLRHHALPMRGLYLLPVLLMAAGGLAVVLAACGTLPAWLVGVWVCYLATLAVFAVGASARAERVVYAAGVPVVAALLHLAWGVGFLCGAVWSFPLAKGERRPVSKRGARRGGVSASGASADGGGGQVI
jgi:GT2 family glycosyltransferase